jgi:acetoacetyl-CoA synthetase
MHVGRDVWINPISGGTDFAGAFVGGVPTLLVVMGEMQGRCLGARVEAFNEQGQPVVDEVGELVCTAPMPSMPLYFWNDPGNKRYLDSYFDMYPGVWRHGDWIRITPRGGAIIYGRSDTTINRHGVRMGTSDIYSVVEALPEVLDSLVVDLEYLGRESYMPMFVVLRRGVALDEPLIGRIQSAIRAAASRAPFARPHPERHSRGRVAAPCAGRRVCRGRGAAHADRQEARTADQEAAAWPAARQGGQPRRAGQPGQPGLVS